MSSHHNQLLNDVVKFICSASKSLSFISHTEDSSTVSSQPRLEIPTAVVVAGVNMPDHDILFEQLKKKLDCCHGNYSCCTASFDHMQFRNEIESVTVQFDLHSSVLFQMTCVSMLFYYYYYYYYYFCFTTQGIQIALMIDRVKEIRMVCVEGLKALGQQPEEYIHNKTIS